MSVNIQSKLYCCCVIIIVILFTFSLLFLNNNSATVQSAIGQSLSSPPPSSSLASNTNTTTTASNFLTYNNPILGIQIQYPSDWSVIENSYNPKAENNTIIGFFAQSKTSSELGNISGVSGIFVPYLDIYVFDSKNMSFDKIVDATVNKFRNNENFVINESKPFAVKDNHPAHILVYDAIVGGDEFFRKMQVYVMSELNSFNKDYQKPVNIQLHIGKIPVIAVENSDGDLQMLKYVDDDNNNEEAKSLMVLIHHDDAVREYSYDKGAENVLKEA
ncbi:MAG TPA: PsbP-related protein [Nitrososphaeraceae archaeon]|nr:PsbP-related protein [Nitrososphaeraceae archaeon]